MTNLTKHLCPWSQSLSKTYTFEMVQCLLWPLILTFFHLPIGEIVFNILIFNSKSLQYNFQVSYTKFYMLYALFVKVHYINFPWFITCTWPIIHKRTLNWLWVGKCIGCFCRKVVFLSAYSITNSFTLDINLNVGEVLKSLNLLTSSSFRCTLVGCMSFQPLVFWVHLPHFGLTWYLSNFENNFP